MKMIKRFRNTIMSIFVSTMLIIGAVGCVGCKSCSVDGDGKPVAPETYSNENGKSGEPSLPYFKPWWKD